VIRTLSANEVATVHQSIMCLRGATADEIRLCSIRNKPRLGFLQYTCTRILTLTPYLDCSILDFEMVKGKGGTALRHTRAALISVSVVLTP